MFTFSVLCGIIRTAPTPLEESVTTKSCDISIPYSKIRVYRIWPWLSFKILISTAFSCIKRHFPPKLSNDSFQPQVLTFRPFQNLPILDQLSTLIGPRVAYRNMHFEPADFVLFAIAILKNVRIQKTVNATVPFSIGSLDIKGFDGQKFLNVCRRYRQSWKCTSDSIK